MAESDDGFVGRWSRLKRGERIRDEIPGSVERGPAPAPLPAGDAEVADPADSAVVEHLPDIDSLDESADFTVFLKEGVPEELRKRALRKLWRLNPVFANLDGLNDYDEDFTAAGAALEGVKTLYQVGKGMVLPEEPAREAAADTDPVADTGEPLAEVEGSADGGAEAGPGQIGQMVHAPAPDSTEGAEATRTVESEAAGAPVEPAQAPTGRSAARRRWGRFES
ncbi:MAG: DUF3306 domain-containing protein [Rhodospirillales bacterium]|nr:DUF3306 domain-containing protein [Rhodospirillales bacterium]MDH3791583.1 DUF3306 domain-containing protein [Rhodospirillales bacterium]MDH3910608.1 DUF3306 domain-containing protein [Rhodospirillales bacterium]MDH3917201.1 DUF3306 domain-containing protein [Rhodospirillales bacterium]MDH3965893.1 DUF3306 domain-containing protein [Rhodospirillales bacterium]